jgi:LysM repeat protein
MNRWKRLLFYLSVNVLVSACTMALVLYLWGRFTSVRSEEADLPPASVPTVTLSPGPSTTPSPLPPATVALQAYQVQPGDTLGSIAEQFGVSVELLIEVNGLTDPNALGSGQVLLVPVTPAPPAASPTGTPGPTRETIPTRTSGLSDEDPQVEITAIVGAGALADERVVIRHNGEGELSLSGWLLESSQGDRFAFPQLTLFKEGAVSVYTRAGANNVVELYWGRTEPVWQVGETATLIDPQGNVRATYTIP